MVQSLQLGGASNKDSSNKRLNRVPIIVAIALTVLFLGVISYGLSSRGFYFQGADGIGQASNASASTYADQLKRGVKDAIIGDPEQTQIYQPGPVSNRQGEKPQQTAETEKTERARNKPGLEPEEEWLARLGREQKEQFLRERHRQQMASLQAKAAALDSPLAVDVSLKGLTAADTTQANSQSAKTPGGASDLYAAAMQAGLSGQNGDPNMQSAKDSFFNQDIKDLGYLPNKVVPQLSRYELKRGSVIPATLITGISSDLPGRITAQTSQNVYDSATGHQLLVPQGAKLFGRYDHKISFGQSRVLVVWTDIIFPNGSTLQLGGMAGTDAEGYGGFRDQIDRHYLQTFGSAVLIALIGTGVDMAMPESSTEDTASDAARRNFADVFGRLAERSVGKNLDVQPTLQIRPGYKFNVLVDQDVVFPGPYRN
ncbi:IncP-type conjugal transfer protein TrbI [Rhizobium ruizarguesonis]|uniref:IncP-type conjugal transfer protein TrbI n=1 Tax=Rhizobium ruizarguesonis TaxID=2081791 RepID=UPI0013E052AB|nr:IncP-type conjugal transfer protein TrbI [Rhizobium ruizarguesonis]NEJ91283.1 IncP-type conjugal transfer protein TrbI [Rhizobium ruizarguesonis]